MGMGFAPIWLRQVSPPASQNHFNHCRILFIAVSIKNIVDMSGNKQFVKTRAQPPSHVAVAKTRSITAHYARTAHTESTRCRPYSVRPSVRPRSKCLILSQFSHFFSAVI